MLPCTSLSSLPSCPASPVLSAYVYYSLSPAYYQLGTSYIKATSLATNVVAGVIGDLLVVVWGVSLRTLMWISAISVCLGCVVGVVVLRPPTALVQDGNGVGRTEQRVSDEKVGVKEHLLAENHRGSAQGGLSSSSASVPGAAAAAVSVEHKLRQFREQLYFLVVAFRSRTLAALMSYWVVGNAVFSVRCLCPAPVPIWCCAL